MDDAGEIGGYRVLRRLAVGARCTLLLAHDDGAPDSVVLKVAPADDPAALREASALDRGAGDHVLPLIDACADDERLVLVLPRLPGPDLARLLVDRADLEAGEAVTILAPLATTLGRLHAAGVAHGGLDAAAVLFDRDGAPTLIGFGAASVFDPGLPEVGLETVPAVAADRAALRALATAVLGRVGGARRSAAQRLLVRLASTPDAELVGLLGRELFEVAAALPVRFSDPAPALGGPAGRLVPVSAPVASSEPSSRPGWAARVEALLDRSPGVELRRSALARWSSLPVTRRRVLLGVTAAAVTLVVAIVALPGAPAPRAAGEARPSEPASASAASRPPRPSASTPEAPEAVRGDDPAAAAAALLRTRADCRRQLSVLCLDDVDQDGSSAAASDRDAIRAAQAGGELAADPLPAPGAAAPRLSERLGGSALIALSGGSSILLVRGGDRWRIRDILGAPSASPAP